MKLELIGMNDLRDQGDEKIKENLVEFEKFQLNFWN